MIEEILSNSNEALAKAERQEAVVDLHSRVDDWRNHRIHQFGELLLFGTFVVSKSDTPSKEVEREVSFDPSSRSHPTISSISSWESSSIYSSLCPQQSILGTPW